MTELAEVTLCYADADNDGNDDDDGFGGVDETVDGIDEHIYEED